MLKFKDYIKESITISNNMESELEYLDIDVICDVKKLGYDYVDSAKAKIFWNFNIIKKLSQVDVDVTVNKIDLTVFFIDENGIEIEKEYTFSDYSDIESNNTPEKLPINITNLEVNLNTNKAKVEFS